MLEKLRETIEKPFPFVTNSNLKVKQMESGYVNLVIPIAGYGNHIKTMYAGALFTLSEMAGGALCFASFDMSRFILFLKTSKLNSRRQQQPMFMWICG